MAEPRRALTKKQVAFVAAYLGAANGNATEACRMAGYAGDATVLAVAGHDLLRNPKIAARIAESLAKVERRGIAIKQTRIDAKVERWHALNAVRLARADALREQIEADAKLPAHRRRPVPPGWETGLHVRQRKAIPIGRGQNEIIDEYLLDATMLRELLSLEKEIAAEFGESGERTLNVRHSGQVAHVARSDLSMLSDAELDQLAALAEKIEAGEVAG